MFFFFLDREKKLSIGGLCMGFRLDIVYLHLILDHRRVIY